LEEQAEKLKGQISEKQRAKRQMMYEWNRLGTESEGVRKRAEAAEENVQKVEAMEISDLLKGDARQMVEVSGESGKKDVNMGDGDDRPF
jgi:hypothetical protein